MATRLPRGALSSDWLLWRLILALNNNQVLTMRLNPGLLYQPVRRTEDTSWMEMKNLQEFITNPVALTHYFLDNCEPPQTVDV